MSVPRKVNFTKVIRWKVAKEPPRGCLFPLTEKSTCFKTPSSGRWGEFSTAFWRKGGARARKAASSTSSPSPRATGNWYVPTLPTWKQPLTPWSCGDTFDFPPFLLPRGIRTPSRRMPWSSFPWRMAQKSSCWADTWCRKTIKSTNTRTLVASPILSRRRPSVSTFLSWILRLTGCFKGQEWAASPKVTSVGTSGLLLKKKTSFAPCSRRSPWMPSSAGRTPTIAAGQAASHSWGRPASITGKSQPCPATSRWIRSRLTTKRPRRNLALWPQRLTSNSKRTPSLLWKWVIRPVLLALLLLVFHLVLMIVVLPLPVLLLKLVCMLLELIFTMLHLTPGFRSKASLRLIYRWNWRGPCTVIAVLSSFSDHVHSFVHSFLFL